MTNTTYKYLVQRALIVWTVCLAICAAFPSLPAEAGLAPRAFTKRYSTNAYGNIYLIGNTLMSCATGVNATGGSSCTSVRDGTATGGSPAGNDLNNNNNIMQNVDADSDSSTFNSSSANLSMPAGSSVLWAGLYWAGENADTAARATALFKTPGSFGYTPLNATQVDYDGTVPPRYSSFIDVTSLVQAGGNGTYWVANVQTTTGSTNHLAGWAMIVVFKNNSLKLRNLSVFDGYQSVANAGTSVNIPVNGFLTPLSGPVSTILGAMTSEGDRNLLNDQYLLNNIAMFDATHASNNFFNSSISDLGVNVSTKSPNYVNQLGFDISRIDATGTPFALANGATSAVFTATTASDQYYPTFLTFATDLYVPEITPNLVKTITKVGGSAGANMLPGDSLRFTISMTNTGLDTATYLNLVDKIPAYTTYVPNSLRVISGANPGAKSDASGDDQAEYDGVSVPPRVVFRLGTGANAVIGGNLPYTAATSLSFDVTINANTPAGTIISNAVDISHQGQTIATVFAGTSAAATAVITTPASISKTFVSNPIAVNGTSVLQIVVSNPASNSATLNGVAFDDTYPAGLINHPTTPNASISCTAGSSASLSGGASGGNTIGMSGGTILLGGNCTISVTVTSASQGNYDNTTSPVTSTNGGTGGTATATLSVGKPAVTLKSFSPASILASVEASTVSFTLTNPNAVPLSNVAFSDTLTNMVVATPNGVTNPVCSTGTVTATAGSGSISLAGASLPANGSCTFSVKVSGSSAGNFPNQTSGVTSTETGAAGIPSNIAYLTVVAPPTATVSFSPPSIRNVATSTSQLKITVSNPNATTTITRAATMFTSTYNPAGLVNATVPNPAVSCSAGSSATLVGGGAGNFPIGLSNVSLAPNGSCSVSVYVSSTTANNYTVSSGVLSTDNAGSGTAASAVLNVTSLAAPTITKSFLTTPLTQGSPSVLRITLANSSATAMTGAAFSDIYPAGLVNTATPAGTTTCAGGTVTANANDTSVSLSGATIPATGNCRVDVNVTANAQGSYFNSIPIGGLTTANGGVNTADASATLSVTGAPVTIKYFGSNPVLPGATSRMNISVSNPNTFTMTGVSFTDNYPPGLVNATPANPTISCSTGSSATLTGGADGGTFIAINSGSILAPSATAAGSCLISVNVKAAAAGNYINDTGAVTTTNSGTGLAGVSTLTVMGPPVVAKSFATNPLTTNASSVMTITFTNNNAAAITGLTFADNYPPGLFNSSSPAVVNTCGGSYVAAANGGSLSLSGATVPLGSSCSISVNVTAPTAGDYLNSTGTITTANAGSAAAATSTLSVLSNVSGYVYTDANHNGARDGGEAGSGTAFYVKLTPRSGAVCSGPATAVATADPATGAYSLNDIAAGNYCLVLDDNSALGDSTPTYPAGYAGTEIPDGKRLITIGSNLFLHNFGVYSGSTISGRVLSDTGIGGGTAYDAIANGGESGIGGVTVRLLDAADTVLDTRISDSSGYFNLHIPGTVAGGAQLKIVETNPAGYLSTGAASGTTGGAYVRAGDTITFTNTPGSSYSGIVFADVPESRFLTDNTATALPGSTVFHGHTFVSGAPGSVTFSTSAIASPPATGWSEMILWDKNCDGKIDSGDQTLSGAKTVAAGETVCLLIKEFVPSGAPVNAINKVTVTADLVYSGVSPALGASFSHADLTSVGIAVNAGLQLDKAVDKSSALPGENIVYTITYRNASSGVLDNIVIHDSVPTFTTLSVSAPNPCCVNPVSACLGTAPAAFPANITACVPSTSGDAITWTLNGTLAPGASGKVKFGVTIQP